MYLPPPSRCIERKGVKAGAILQELISRRFSGQCLLLVGGVRHILVFENGQVILAESQEKKGDSAFQEVLSIEQRETEALICELDAEALKEAIRTNDAWAVKGGQKAANGEKPTVTKVKPVSIRQGDAKKIQIRSITVRGEEEKEQAQPAKIQSTTEHAPPSSRNLERMTLESIKEMSESFKSDAANLLKELNMEYLMVTKREKKEKTH